MKHSRMLGRHIEKVQGEAHDDTENHHRNRTEHPKEKSERDIKCPQTE
jgi:hypothetical protein